jgi:hypothetical protein
MSPKNYRPRARRRDRTSKFRARPGPVPEVHRPARRPRTRVVALRERSETALGQAHSFPQSPPQLFEERGTRAVRTRRPARRILRGRRSPGDTPRPQTGVWPKAAVSFAIASIPLPPQQETAKPTPAAHLPTRERHRPDVRNPVAHGHNGDVPVRWPPRQTRTSARARVDHAGWNRTIGGSHRSTCSAACRCRRQRHAGCGARSGRSSGNGRWREKLYLGRAA